VTAVAEGAGAPPPGVRPGVFDLAAPLSIAVRIEPELVRAVRMRLFPHMGVETESDLWFHPDLVRSRGSEGIVLDTQWRATLQAHLSHRLESEPEGAPVHRTWETVSRVHAHASPALRVEEEINWLAVSGRASQIDAVLAPALKAVADEGREGVARWFAAAWNRLPQAARETVAAWKLAQVSEALIPGTVKLRHTAAPGVETADLADIVGFLGDTKIGVRRFGDDIELGNLLQGPNTFAITVPNTSPRVLTLLEGRSSSEQCLTVPIGGSVRAGVDSPTVRLRTARGSVFEIPVRDAPRDTGRVEIETREKIAEAEEAQEGALDSREPVFFLSYAHDGGRTSAENGSDRRVEQLFIDLSEDLSQLISRPTGAELGFFDRSMRSGASWRNEMFHALGTCQVFVALMSAPYFESEWCGWEWAAFAARATTSRKGSMPVGSSIVPVIWAPNLTERVPRAVAEIQHFKPRSEPEVRPYQENGLLGLQIMGRSDIYRSVVWQLARHVADLYYTNAVLSREFSVEQLPNAFQDDA
jgi:hypothetical protein